MFIDEQLRLTTAHRLETIINQNASIAEMEPLITEIVDKIISKSDVVINMNHLNDHHEYTYLHCVNVGILSVSIGVKLNFIRDDLIQLGAAGILHDIGKKKIPLEVLDKQGKLTDEEYDLIKKHSVYGYNMLSNALEVSKVSKTAILQHHERCDGSGYPKGLVGDKITIFGRILAVADTYDAMTSDRSYRKAFSPFETIEFLMGDGNRLYDWQVVESFMKCIVVYPIGTRVELSDGTIGIVKQNNSDCVLRPVIQNTENKAVIDLKNDKDYLNLCITKVIE
jgi:putative nucleotidyltransferase with HDIG domain